MFMKSNFITLAIFHVLSWDTDKHQRMDLFTVKTLATDTIIKKLLDPFPPTPEKVWYFIRKVSTSVASSSGHIFTYVTYKKHTAENHNVIILLNVKLDRSQIHVKKGAKGTNAPGRRSFLKVRWGFYLPLICYLWLPRPKYVIVL